MVDAPKPQNEQITNSFTIKGKHTKLHCKNHFKQTLKFSAKQNFSAEQNIKFSAKQKYNDLKLNNQTKNAHPIATNAPCAFADSTNSNKANAVQVNTTLSGAKAQSQAQASANSANATQGRLVAKSAISEITSVSKETKHRKNAKNVNFNNAKKGTNTHSKARIKIYPSAKYILLWLFAFVFALVAVCLVSNDKDGLFNPVSAVYTDGNGTESDPYIISTADNLKTLASNVNSGNAYSSTYFKMANNITISTTSWTPIGSSSSTPFSGNFDGGGYAITFSSPVTITSSDTICAGVFGYATGATIENLGANWAGGDGSTTWGLSVTVNVSGHAIVGGIVGFIDDVNINNCYNTGTIKATSPGTRLGGICGAPNTNSTNVISNCYNSASLTGDYNGDGDPYSSDAPLVSGIISYDFKSSNTNVYTCYNIGKLYSSGPFARTSGIIMSGTVTNCFSAVGIKENNDSGVYIHAIGGYNSNITNCYYDYVNGTPKDTDSVQITNLADLMKVQSNFSGTIDGTSNTWSDEHPWDFAKVWTIESKFNNGYPILKTSLAGFADYTVNDATDLLALAGKKTSTTSNQNFSAAWGSGTSSPYIYMTNDITVPADTTWTPIGNSSTPFYGVFDGGGHLITFDGNVTITSSASSSLYVGLFGYAYSSAKIQNVGVNWIAGLTGKNTYNSTSYTYCYVGGIVGYSQGCIRNCFNIGNVESICTYNIVYAYAGGIVGNSYSASSSIINCYNIGNVSASGNSDTYFEYAGGIVGDGGGTVSNCYNLRVVNLSSFATSNAISGQNDFVYKAPALEDSKAYTGGISGSGGDLYNCFSVVGTSNYSGAGIVDADASTDGCYFDYGTTSGDATGGVQITGLADLMKVESNFTAENGAIGTTGKYWNTGADYVWDFKNVWAIDENINNGYPVLRAFYDIAEDELLTFDIALISNGANVGTLSVVDSVPQDTKVTVPTRSGYSFLGYYNGETQYINENGAVEQDSSYYMTEIAELTAKWKANEYTITYYDQDGNTLSGNNASNPSTYTIESAEITLQAPTSRSGYTFAGWSTTKGGDILTSATIASGSTGNKKFYANWTVIPYTITCKDSKTNATLKTYSYTVEDAVTLYTPSKTGYAFTGWSTAIGGTKQPTVTISKGTTGNKTYYANWTLITYTIAYKDVNNEDISTDNPSSYNIETATITLKAPTTTPTGKVFVRWSTTQDGTSPITQIAQASTVNYTLYAIFADATVTLTLKCTNFANQNYMIYIYDGETQVMQVYPNSATQTITLKYTENQYTVQFVFGYYGQIGFGTCVNATSSGRKVVLDYFDADATASISYTISTPKLNGIVI